MVGTAGAIIITVLVLVAVAAVGWVLYSRWRAQRLGLPPPGLASFIPFRKRNDASSYGPPQPAPGGIQGWINDRIRMFKNRNNRTATGAYEGSGSAGRAGRRGFGPLDPDDAWDARVGTEADNYGPGGYYEEQELGLAPRHGAGADDEETGYRGAGSDSYQMNLAATPQMPPAGFGQQQHEDRGRTLNRDPGLAPAGAVPGGRNPFEDDAEPSNMSLRGVSPRPIDTAEPAKGQAAKGQQAKDPADSPTERRSIFREGNM